MKLQNNFTTPEQSKRLLELGLPADSADCYYNGDYSRIEVLEQGFCAVRPCWSVGRLIEIYCVCGYNSKGNTVVFATEPMVDRIIKRMEDYKPLGLIDFSKLEE